MNTNKVQNRVYVSDRTLNRTVKKAKNVAHGYVSNNNVSFKGASGDFAKKFWFNLRRLGNQMKDNTEMQNALIAAIGTGVIAPAIILVSPGKGDEQDKKKKFTQALRQPISALFALGFQVPATMFITREMDKLVFDKQTKAFKDKYIGDIIPNEKYLAKKVTDKEISALEADFEKIVNGKSLRQELEAIIKEDFDEVGLKISDSELAKRVSKNKEKFLREKLAKQKYEQLMEQKFEDIIKNPEKYEEFTKILKNIKEIDLVTEDYMNVAAQKYKAEYNEIAKRNNLSLWDKTVEILGFENKKLKKVKKEQDIFKKERGLELLKKDSPELFKDEQLKIKTLLKNYQADATKALKGKTFWTSLAVNVCMVAASCFALNWAHPIVNNFLEGKMNNKKDNAQKVEVK